jgi:hypothetical protein
MNDPSVSTPIERITGGMCMDDEYIDVSQDTPSIMANLPNVYYTFPKVFEGVSSFLWRKIDVTSIPEYIQTDLP